MLAIPIAFPKARPPGYEPLDREPVFDPSHHLALEKPSKIMTLKDFGYEDDMIAACPSELAMTSPFRIMSAEGVARLRELALALKAQRFTTNRTGANRLKFNIRGASYRSKFIRDFVTCPLVEEFLSALAGTPLISHSMPSVQAAINYAPDEVGKTIDSWHVDSVGFVFVMMVTDPKRFEGGEFQYFLGTKSEAAELLGTITERLTDGFGDQLPAERVNTVAFPAAGYAFFMQGHMLFHRATRLLKASERITFVPSYVTSDLRHRDPTNTKSMRLWSDPGMWTELARHKAWISRSKLDGIIADLPFTSDRAAICSALRVAIADVENLVHDLETVPDESPAEY
jgi:hypothetical protein